jgi:hypothetical protein
MEIKYARWKGYAPDQAWAAAVAPAFSALSQFIALLVFSGIRDRYARLRWASAETGVGWLNCVLDACDHEWERRRLWTEGIAIRPSERLHATSISCHFQRDQVHGSVGQAEGMGVGLPS